MPSVTFRLPPTLHERFLALCQSRDVRASDMLRDAVERLVDAVDENALGHHGPKDRDLRAATPISERLPLITGRQLQEQGPMRFPKAAPGSRLKVVKP